MIATLLPTEQAARVDLLQSLAMRLLQSDRGATWSLRSWLVFVAITCNGYPREPWLCDALVHIGAMVHGIARRGSRSFVVAAGLLAHKLIEDPEAAAAVLGEAVRWSARLDASAGLGLDTEPSA